VKKSTFLILCLEGAILSFNVAAAAALVPSIARDFALSQFVVGKMIWLYMFPYGIAALIYGPLVRAIDAKKIELVCIFFFSLSNLLAALSGNIYTCFIARFFMGLFGASVIPLGLVLIANHIEQQRRGKYVGIFFSATFVASLLGLFLSGIISWRLIYLIPAIAGLFLTGIIYLYLPSFKGDVTGFKINYFAALGDKRMLFIFAYIFVISLLYHGIQQWLGVYFSDRFGFSQFLISALITLTSLSGIFGEAFGGVLADRFGRIRTANLGVLLMVISALLLILKLPFVLLALLMIVWGLGWTFNHAGISTVLTDLPREFLNEAASLNSSVRFISGGVGAALGGVLMQRGFSVGFVVFGVSLAALLFLSKTLESGR